MGCACGGVSKTRTLAAPGVRYGEVGLLPLESMNGIDTDGEVTGYIYPFSKKRRLFVDKRDAVYLLGEEYSLWEYQ